MAILKHIQYNCIMTVIKKIIAVLVGLSAGGLLVGGLLFNNRVSGQNQSSGLLIESNSAEGYFTGEKRSANDNVLPPIYIYEYKKGKLAATDRFAIDYKEDLLGALDNQSNFLMPNGINKEYQIDKNKFIDNLIEKAKKFFYIDNKYANEKIKECVKLKGTYKEGGGAKRLDGDFNSEKCSKWFQTGYMFVFATLGEVRKVDELNGDYSRFLKGIDIELQNKYKECYKGGDKNKSRKCAIDKYFEQVRASIEKAQGSEDRFMTLTYVDESYGVKPNKRESFTLQPQNTAIVKQRDDVVAYKDDDIKPSPVVIIWQKDGKTRIPVWALRLKCANPLGTLLPDNRSANLGAQVSVDRNYVRLQPDGKETVTFTYQISKKAKDKKFDAKYTFSGRNGDYFSPNNVKYSSHKLKKHKFSGVVPQDFKTLIKEGGGGKVVLGDRFLEMAVEYKEVYELDATAKNWRSIGKDSGELCRTIKIKNQKDKDIKIKGGNEVCVKIEIRDEKGKGLYINPLTPEIVSPGYPINELTNGLVTYAIRPKQWEDKSEQKTASGSCGNTESEVKESVTSQCNKVCSDSKEDKIQCNVAPSATSESCCSSYTCSCNNGYTGPDGKPVPSTNDCCCSDTKYSASGTCTYLKRSTADTNWRVTKFLLYPEDKAVNASMNLDNNEEPCKYYTGRTTGNNCVTQFSGSNQFDSSSIYSIVGGHNPLSGLMRIHITPRGVGGSIAKAIPGFADSKYDVDNLPTGTKVCFGVSVNKWQLGNASNSNTTIEWAHSKPECFVVSKKPYFSVKNGLVVSGGKIITGLNKRKGNNNVAGSATEYAAISGGRISPQFSTSLLLDGSVRVQTADYMNWHRLTLANPDPNDLGSFGKPPEDLIKAIDYFRVRGKSHNGNFVAHQAGVYVVKGKATISGNIVDTKTNKGANSGNPRNIQQMVIIADEIEIKNNVTQIDAWLMTSGVLSTSDHALTDAGVKAGADESKLMINGPVYAKHIRLRRKYGSGIKSDKNPNNLASGKNQLSEPAERFIDNTDTYIWGYYNSLERGQYQTVYMREVAPRY